MFEVGGTKIEQVPTMGDGESKFWDFCEKVIIECPPLENLEMDLVYILFNVVSWSSCLRYIRRGQ